MTHRLVDRFTKSFKQFVSKDFLGQQSPILMGFLSDFNIVVVFVLSKKKKKREI